jgi:hypothetical protein
MRMGDYTTSEKVLTFVMRAYAFLFEKVLTYVMRAYAFLFAVVGFVFLLFP